MKIIGLVGTIGAGKDVVSEYLQKKYGYSVIVMGDIVRELTQKKGLETSRENLQAVQKEYIDKCGYDFFAKEVVNRIRKGKWENVVINGMRRPPDLLVPKKEFRNSMIVILVDADTKLRFERMVKRARVGDPKTLEEFQRQEQSEWRLFNFKETISHADYTVKNNGTLGELYAHVDKLLKKTGFGK